MARSKLYGSLSWPIGLLSAAALIAALPQPSKADVVVAALCAVQQYPCVGANILDSGIRNDGLNLLGGNTFDIMNFNFADAAVTFNGTMMATDIAGRWIYLWGSGTATDLLGGALNLNVAFTESYLTVPGNWTFNDMIVGGCAGGTGPNSGAIAQGVVNATGLTVIGGNCSNFNPFASVGFPVNGNLGGLTRLTGAAQFVFTAGSAAGSTVTLPWGEDFPDPAVTFNDSSNPINDIDPANDSGLGLSPTPEPGALPWLAGAMVLLGVARHRASRRNRLLASVSL